LGLTQSPSGIYTDDYLVQCGELAWDEIITAIGLLPRKGDRPLLGLVFGTATGFVPWLLNK
jgi:hypothetical protein